MSFSSHFASHPGKAVHEEFLFYSASLPEDSSPVFMLNASWISSLWNKLLLPMPMQCAWLDTCLTHLPAQNRAPIISISIALLIETFSFDLEGDCFIR